MCASSPEKYEVLDPPPGSLPGDRITCEGYTGVLILYTHCTLLSHTYAQCHYRHACTLLSHTYYVHYCHTHIMYITVTHILCTLLHIIIMYITLTHMHITVTHILCTLLSHVIYSHTHVIYSHSHVHYYHMHVHYSHTHAHYCHTCTLLLHTHVLTYTGTPDGQLNPKKKIFEQIKPDLRTNDEGVACYKGIPFTVEGKGVCRAATMRNSGIE